MPRAFQDHYSAHFSSCYGCGANNPAGHQLKSYWDGDRTVARFTPDRKFSGGVPDHVYGGLVASLLDCHGNATAFAFAHRALEREMGSSDIRFVTAMLQVNFRNPTPMGVELLITGNLKSLVGRKARIDLALHGDGVECATGEMLAISVTGA